MKKNILIFTFLLLSATTSNIFLMEEGSAEQGWVQINFCNDQELNDL